MRERGVFQNILRKYTYKIPPAVFDSVREMEMGQLYSAFVCYAGILALCLVILAGELFWNWKRCQEKTSKVKDPLEVVKLN